MEQRTFERWRERQAERMRQGQAVCTIEHLLSDPEIRLALVPITDAEHQNALEMASAVPVADNEHGIIRRDREQQNAVIYASGREVGDLTKRFFESISEVRELGNHDINHLWDMYSEMVSISSPSIDGLSPEEFEALKKGLAEMDWNELSGRQWYAARRFLSSITPQPLLAKSPGFSSTRLSTEMNTEIPSVPSAQVDTERQSAQAAAR